MTIEMFNFIKGMFLPGVQSWSSNIKQACTPDPSKFSDVDGWQVLPVDLGDVVGLQVDLALGIVNWKILVAVWRSSGYSWKL